MERMLANQIAFVIGDLGMLAWNWFAERPVLKGHFPIPP